MDEPRIPNPKAALSKVKGLPPWAYVAAVGVGGAAIWFGINRSRSSAASDAADITGDYGGTLSATSSGDAYPTGSQGAGYYYDPTAAAVDPSTNEDDWDHFLSLLEVVGVTGGGGNTAPDPVSNYVPPSIVVNIPESAIPQSQVQPTAVAVAAPTSGPAKAPDPCKGEFNFLQDQGTRKGMCYKIVVKGGKRYKYYKNGDKILA